jgi:hypothetical protein
VAAASAGGSSLRGEIERPVALRKPLAGRTPRGHDVLLVREDPCAFALGGRADAALDEQLD